MAGARTQGVGRGVRWDAFGNIASLLARAGQAKGEGYASLGAGIGGGISALGANRRQAKRDADLLAERQEERAYRRGRDETQDRQWQASFDLNKSNVEADNRRQDESARAMRLGSVGQSVMAAVRAQQEAQQIELSERRLNSERLGKILEQRNTEVERATFNFGPDSPQARKAMEQQQHAMQAYSALGGENLDLGGGPDLSMASPAAPPMTGQISAEPARAMGQSMGPTISLPGMPFGVGMGDLAPESRESMVKMVAALQTLKQARDEKGDYDKILEALPKIRESKLAEAKAAREKLAEAGDKSHVTRERLGLAVKRTEIAAHLAVTGTAKLESMTRTARDLAMQRAAAKEAEREAAEIKSDPAYGLLTPEEQAGVTRREDINLMLRRRAQQAEAERKQVMDARAAENQKMQRAKFIEQAWPKDVADALGGIEKTRAIQTAPGNKKTWDDLRNEGQAAWTDYGDAVPAYAIISPVTGGDVRRDAVKHVLTKYKGDKKAAFDALWATVPDVPDDEVLASWHAALAAALDGK